MISFLRKVHWWLQRRRKQDELREELEFHLAEEASERQADGLAEQEAKWAARRDLGNASLLREEVRTFWSWALLDQLAQDVRYALRTLRKSPGFTLTAVVTVALGIGANTAVFTIVHTVLFQSLPLDRPEKIMYVNTLDVHGRELGTSLQDFEDWRDASRTFSGLALVFNPVLTLATEDQLPEPYGGAYISAVGFELIGRKAALGRVFRQEDDRPGAAAVVLISDSLWRNRFAADPSVIGKAVKINAVPTTIIGVMPKGFQFPFNEHLWVPIAQLPPAFQQRGRDSRFFFAYGRLGEGVTIDQARSEFRIIASALAQQHPKSNADTKVAITPFLERAIDPRFSTLSWASMAAVGFVLLIACANVANLLLSRSVRRGREIILRTSLGATRWRIVRQLLVESLVLVSVGGVIGLALSFAGIGWFDANTAGVGRPYWMDFSMNIKVVAFFTTACVLTGVLFGLAPALHLSRIGFSDILKRGQSGTETRSARRWTAVLLVAQLTLTAVLLNGAGLLMRSFVNQYQLDVGIDTSNLLTMRVLLPARKYPTFDSVMAFLQRVDDQLNTLSTIEHASTTTSLPLFGLDSRDLVIEGRPIASEERPSTVTMISVGPQYFDTLGVRLLSGRAIQYSDGSPGHEVAVINQHLAARHFPNEDAIGKRITLTDDIRTGTQWPWATIVGVVPTIRQRSLQDEPEGGPVVYIPNVQNLAHRNGTLIMVRGRIDAAHLLNQIRQEIFAIDPDLPLSDVSLMDQLLARYRWPSRVFGTMFTAFALVALVLAAIGVYAATAYTVMQRVPEISVRRALGAQRRHIVSLVVRRIAVVVTVGVILGLTGALATGPFLQDVLVVTTPTDLVTFTASVTILVAATAFACLLPTRRALKLEPMRALSHE